MTVLILIIVVAYIVYRLTMHHKNAADIPQEDSGSQTKFTITEDGISKQQIKFEKRLENNYAPDAISGDEIYIYKNLMRVWYDQLSSKNRYDNALAQKLRDDWSDYMSSLEDRSTNNYLWLEEKDEKKAEEYRNDHIIASKKVFAIEDAFANMIGADGIKKLAAARKLEFPQIDHAGNLAPEGFVYNTKDELEPKKQSKSK